MKDQPLERIWKSRDTISKRCGYDPRRLVRYMQQRKKDRLAEQRLAANRGSATTTPR
jgi:hypothetical protein